MDFLIELLAELLKKEGIKFDINLSGNDLTNLLEKTCFRVLKKIQGIVRDDSLTDFDCVEKIVSNFEEFGLDGGFRHDLG